MLAVEAPHAAWRADGLAWPARRELGTQQEGGLGQEHSADDCRCGNFRPQGPGRRIHGSAHETVHPHGSGSSFHDRNFVSLLNSVKRRNPSAPAFTAASLLTIVIGSSFILGGSGGRGMGGTLGAYPSCRHAGVRSPKNGKSASWRSSLLNFAKGAGDWPGSADLRSPRPERAVRADPKTTKSGRSACAAAAKMEKSMKRGAHDGPDCTLKDDRGRRTLFRIHQAGQGRVLEGSSDCPFVRSTTKKQVRRIRKGSTTQGRLGGHQIRAEGKQFTGSRTT